jgi:hypothetical protein
MRMMIYIKVYLWVEYWSANHLKICVVGYSPSATKEIDEREEGKAMRRMRHEKKKIGMTDIGTEYSTPKRSER